MVDLRKLSMATRSNEISEVQMTRIRVVVEENMESDMSCQIGHGLYMSKLKPDSNGNTYFQRGKNSVRPKNKVICLSRKSAYHDERSHIQTSDVRDNFSRQSP